MKIAMMVRSFLPTPTPHGIAYSPATIARSVAEGLAQVGHDITFFGPDGTNLKDVTVETLGFRPFFKTMEDFDEQVSTTDLFSDYRFALYDNAMARQMLDRAQAGEFDAVMFHHFESVAALSALYPSVPIVIVLHDYMDNERVRMLDLNRSPNQYFISISNKQRQFAPDLPYAATIYNGIDPSRFIPCDKPSDDTEYLLYSGRVAQIKGVKEAVQVAMQSKHRLLIAGNLSKQDYWYFDEHVKPYLDDRILYLGMLEKEQLIKYYQKAKALLVPIQWEEPFGLTMIEANACGTPVIAFDRGSVSEVIRNGETGYIVNNSAEMILAIEKIDRISSAACRKNVIKNFSVDKMVRSYEIALQSIIDNHTKNSNQGRSKGTKRYTNFAKLSKQLIRGITE